MGFILYLISNILEILIGIFAYIYGTFVSSKTQEWNRWNKNLAIAKDCYGNVLCHHLFNDVLITKEGYKFGDKKETISSVLGKNKRNNTLTKTGWVIVKILNRIHKNHVEQAANQNQ